MKNDPSDNEPPGLMERGWRAYWKIEWYGGAVAIVVIPCIAILLWLGYRLIDGFNWLVGL